MLPLVDFFFQKTAKGQPLHTSHGNILSSFTRCCHQCFGVTRLLEPFQCTDRKLFIISFGLPRY
uniref:Uncharacterized protein n=1 Tax=Arundo donax TaxID=35708 RepID=A0A0A9DG65_ARUDO